jgi:hypothetical protein
MDPRWIAILLILPMMAGCLSVNEIVPDPKEGDLKLTISLSKTLIIPGEGNVSMTIELKNVCDHDLMVEELFAFGGGLFPRVHASNGSWVELSYPLYDYEPKYSQFHPGETKIITETLVPISIEIDGTERDFNWDIPGSYNVSVIWWGIERSTFNVTSNTEYLTVGDHLDPQEGDLSLTISMPRTVFLIKPDRMEIAIVLRNICDHPVLIEDHFSLSFTLFGHAISSNGTRIVFYRGFDPDYQETYSPLYPGRSMVETIDLIGISYVEEHDWGCEFYWNVPDTYILTMCWYGLEETNTNLSCFCSNKISITIKDCPHPQEGDLSLAISMSQYPVSSNDMNLTVEITNVCGHPVLISDWFLFGCSLSGVVILPNKDIVEIPDHEIDRPVTYSSLEPEKSKIAIFDLSTLDHEWDDPGIYHVSVVYHDELNNSAPVASNEITYEIIDGS